MQIKIIDHRYDSKTSLKKEFVVEATAYLAEIIILGKNPTHEEFLGAVTDFHIPFDLDWELEEGGGILILRILKPRMLNVIATECSVFVMNDQGKTVDRFQVSAKP